jgi:hypothetical protein
MELHNNKRSYLSHEEFIYIYIYIYFFFLLSLFQVIHYIIST